MSNRDSKMKNIKKKYFFPTDFFWGGEAGLFFGVFHFGVPITK